MASALSSGSRGRSGITGINVTPMVDVMLVLLIIMMVAATYIVSQALKVELPRTASSDETVNKTYTVTVTREGQYLFNEKKVTREGLVSELKAARKTSKGDLNLVITADTAAMHGNVVGVIDLAKVEGITKFAINVERR
jgi:biopolymer transport protein ExbD